VIGSSYWERRSRIVSARLLKTSTPCGCCGGALVEIPANLFKQAICHYCDATRPVPLPRRLEFLARSGPQSWRQGATRFLQSLTAGETRPSSLDQLRSALVDLIALYEQGLEELLYSVPASVAGDESSLDDAVTQLARAMLLKAVVTAVGDDPLAPEIADRLVPLVHEQFGEEPWEIQVDRSDLGQLRAVEPDLDWRLLLRPFERLAAFRKRTSELITHTSRIVNLVIKLDGEVSPAELRRATAFRDTMKRRVATFPPLEWETDQPALEPGTLDQLREDGGWVRSQLAAIGVGQGGSIRATATEAQRLAEALRQLDGLIGIAGVKDDVRGLVDVLRAQQERRRQDLPEADLRAHLVFLGSPGTGQGTVAAILGRIHAAVGSLARGHLTEVSATKLDAGQVSIDERLATAREGVLLVHDAARLCDPGRPDARRWTSRLLTGADTGHILLILSDERSRMQEVLAADPELLRRVRQLEFEDHSAVELGRVLESLAKAARYRLTRQARIEVSNALCFLVARDGRLPGNGRAMRDLLQAAVERQAARVASAADLAPPSLVTLDADDFVFDTVPDAVRRRQPAVIWTECPRCGRRGRLSPELLGSRIQCRACQHEMIADWGVPAE
jgi:hypothetical protein